MKKFMKVCAVTAAVMLGVGIVLAFTAGLMRGRDVVARVVDSVTDGRLHVNLWDQGDWGIYFDDGQTADDKPAGGEDLSQYLVDGEVSRMEIELGGYWLEIVPSSDDSFYLASDYMDKIQCQVKNNTLHVKAVRSGIEVGGSARDRKIALHVPKDKFFEDVEIELGAGLVEIKDLNVGEISLNVGAGMITADAITARELEAGVGAGEILLNDIETEELSVEVGMGECVASCAVGRSADLECSMGNLELTLEGSEKDFNYKLEVSAGSVDVGESSYGGLAGERTIRNGAAKNVEAECSMGDITIRFTE